LFTPQLLTSGSATSGASEWDQPTKVWPYLPYSAASAATHLSHALTSIQAQP
jgi:hypothetical protein